MALIQRKLKMNDFRVASMTRNYKIGVGDAYRGTLGHAISNKGTHLSAIGPRDDDFIFVFHLEKKRPKFVQKQVLVKNGYGGTPRNTTKSAKIRDTEWTIRVFKFPKNIVKSVKQHARHFDIEIKIGA